MQIVRTKKATASNKKERFKLLGEMGVPVQNGSKFFSGVFGTRHEIQPFFASVCIFSPPPVHSCIIGVEPLAFRI